MTFKTLSEVLASSACGADGKVKYPLDCGCTSPHQHNMCVGHQEEMLFDKRRLMGIADLRFTHRDLTDLPSLGKALAVIQLHLIANPTKSLLIKIIPETQDEANARRRD